MLIKVKRLPIASKHIQDKKNGGQAIKVKNTDSEIERTMANNKINKIHILLRKGLDILNLAKFINVTRLSN